MKKIKNIDLSHKKIAVLLIAICFVWFQASSADESDLNYFDDADRDGLTDEEEISLGTDPNNEDTDGDGYSDGVEIESGYNPLVASPDDRVVLDKSEVDNNKDEDDVNVTEIFIEKLKSEKSIEMNAVAELSSDPESFNEKIDTGEFDDASLTETDISDILNNSLDSVDVEDEIEVISDDEINVLPPVDGNETDEVDETDEIDETDETDETDEVIDDPTEGKDKEVIEEEKKQIEEYFVQVGYVVFERAPFLFEEDENAVGAILSLVMDQVTGDIEEGDRSSLVDYKERALGISDELKDVEVPYVMKDVHKTGISLLNYALGQNEEVVFDDDGPVEFLELTGKVQGVVEEVEGLTDIVYGVRDSYELDSFEVPEEFGL